MDIPHVKYAVLSLLLVAALWYSPFIEAADSSQELADTYWEQAKALEKQSKYLEAAQLYEKSLEAEKASPKPRLASLASELNQAAYCFIQVGQMNKGLAYYQEALEIFQRLGKQPQTATLLSNIGSVYREQGAYEQALDYYLSTRPRD